MEQNENSFTPGAATDEPASSPNLMEPEARRFATAAEEAAYRAGLADPCRDGGGAPARFDFDPVATRYRHDGLTPAKQREYVEALADTGIARAAAARIGVSEQAVGRLRRRADARSFNLACDAAQRFGARRLHSIAWERAIEGTIRRHYYHSELKGEERVYDNRLLIHLLGTTERLLDEPEEALAVAENWQPFVEAMEQGLPPPVLPSPFDQESEEDEPDEDEGLIDSIDVWQEPDGWWTLFPPPAGFDGIEKGGTDGIGYQRTLTREEQKVVDAAEAADRAGELARETARRDAWFGFEGGTREEEIFSAREAEPYETSDPAALGPTAAAGNESPLIAEVAGEDDKEAP